MANVYRRSRSIRKDSGTAETAMSSRAGAAARAKNASEAADHIDVANVSNPTGLNIKVAGSSFITNKNTSAQPASNPGLAIGRVTEENVRIGLLPRLLAASSILGLICSREERTDPKAGEMYKIR